MPPKALGPSHGTLRTAAPGRRALAAVVDGSLWAFAPCAAALALTSLGVPSLPTLGLAVLVGVLGTALAGVVTGVDGRSPGRLLAGTRVVDAAGRPLGVRAGARRSGWKALAGVGSCGTAWLRWAAYGLADPDATGRTPLDLRCGSRVVAVAGVPALAPPEPHVALGPVNLTAQRLTVPDPTTPREGGAPVPVPRAPTLPDRDPDPGGWRLGVDTGESVRLVGSALVGRDPAPAPGVRHLLALVSDDGSLSRSHARIGPVADGRIVLLDDGSTNGTVVVRAGVPHPVAAGRAVPLLEGDQVQVGDRWITVHRDTRVGTR